MRTKYDKRLMQNPLLVWTFLKNHPDADPSSFHSDMEYREQANYLKIRQPEKMITAAQLQKGQLFGVNSCYMSPFDITERVQECIYCGKAFKPGDRLQSIVAPATEFLSFAEGEGERHNWQREGNAEPNEVVRDPIG